MYRVKDYKKHATTARNSSRQNKTTKSSHLHLSFISESREGATKTTRLTFAFGRKSLSFSPGNPLGLQGFRTGSLGGIGSS